MACIEIWHGIMSGIGYKSRVLLYKTTHTIRWDLLGDTYAAISPSSKPGRWEDFLNRKSDEDRTLCSSVISMSSVHRIRNRHAIMFQQLAGGMIERSESEAVSNLRLHVAL